MRGLWLYHSVDAYLGGARIGGGALLAAAAAVCDNSPGNARSGAMESNDRLANEALEGLIARIAQGDQAALAALYDATIGRVYGLALRVVCEHAHAEEVVSDTYYQIWNQAARYDTKRGQVMAWLMTICRSRALDKLRQRAPAESHPDFNELCQDMASDDLGPLDILLTCERGSAIHRALETLDARERLLLSLAFFKGMSHQDIAEHTAMPLGTVKSILRRSMLSLRAMLERAEMGTKELS